MIIRESRAAGYPIGYGGYTPYNANNKFRGGQADGALIRSLNARWSTCFITGVRILCFPSKQARGFSGHLRRIWAVPMLKGGAEISLGVS